MSDPFRKVSPGDPVVFHASSWNAMLEAGKAHRFGQGGVASEAHGQSRSGSLVWVKNEIEDDLPLGSVVGLDEPIFTPGDSVDAFLREVAFRGVEPAAAHAGRFAVLAEPAPEDAVVRAYVAGVVPVRVDVTDAAHACCDVAPGETGYLKSSAAGSAQILWSEGGTGEQWAVVRLGNARPAVLFATNTDEEFEANDTRELDLYNGAEDVLHEDAPVRNPAWSGPYPADARLICGWDGSEWVVIGRWCDEP